MSQGGGFHFIFFHSKIRGPKFCHKEEAFILFFFTQKLGDLLGDLIFVTTTRLSVFILINRLKNKKARPRDVLKGREPRKACNEGEDKLLGIHVRRIYRSMYIYIYIFSIPMEWQLFFVML